MSLSAKDPSAIAGMFDAIAPRYDLLNRLLSAGLDRRWRRRAIDALALAGGETLLDLCAGTGDVALEAAARRGAAPSRIVALDFAAAMLERARLKIARAGAGRVITLVRGDAARLPLAGEGVDAVTIAFGIRNVQDPAAACRECFRVMKRGGRLAVLEFAMPRNAALRRLYRWYFQCVLPRIGRTVSGHGEAYAYLPASVQAFGAPDRFASLLRDCGFSGVRAVRLTAGIVYLYAATKP